MAKSLALQSYCTPHGGGPHQRGRSLRPCLPRNQRGKGFCLRPRAGHQHIRNGSCLPPFAERPQARQLFASLSGGYSEAELAKCDLRDVLARLERGVVPLEGSDARKLWEAVGALETSQKETKTTSHELLSAVWRLLWTTEKETLFILKWAPLFGTRAGGVYQPINVEAGELSNIITFPPSGSFVVNSTIEVLSDKRVGFKFTKATLHLPTTSIDVPPFGQGWFDTIYLDEDFRISKDSRGDTLITEREEDDTALQNAPTSGCQSGQK